MDLDMDVFGKSGLQFFGTMSASISHEIKNVLAILNENAGLLDDLVLLAEKGKPLNNDRIKNVAVSMKQQIKRADLITKNLNRLAHSVDEPMERVDVRDILELVVLLSGRFADMKGIKLEPIYATQNVYIKTSPFLLEYLFYCFIEFSMTMIDDGKTLEIIIEEMEKGLQVKFGGLKRLGEMGPNSFPSEREDTLLKAVHAEMETDGIGRIVIKFSEEI